MERNHSASSDRFEIVKLLGKGACGSVYHVRDLHNDRRDLALKILESSSVLDKFTRDRFIKEILILCTIQHRNLVNAYELVTIDGKDGYTMELVNGHDLGSIVDKLNGQQLADQEISSIMKQLLSALDELHKKNIVHRDIKLDNIMLRDDGVVKLNDLGLAKIMDDNPMTDPGLILGTAHYMSPEYILSKTIDHRADIYACGVILWELMHGKRRFDENSEKVLRELIESDFKYPIPNETAENKVNRRILIKALSVSPEDRFQSAAEMREAFYGHFKAPTYLEILKKYKFHLFFICLIVITLLAT